MNIQSRSIQKKDINMEKEMKEESDQEVKPTVMDNLEAKQNQLNRVMSFVDWIKYCIDWVKGLFGR